MSPSVDDQSLKKAPPVTARPIVPMPVRVAELPFDGNWEPSISLYNSLFFDWDLGGAQFSVSPFLDIIKGLQS